MNIVFIEESQEIRNMCSLVLRKNGHNVTFCQHGLEAFAVIEKEPIDMLMINVRSYLMSAIEVIITIRGQYDKDTLPVVVLGKRSESELILECLEAGGDDSLDLPVKVNDMLQKLAFIEEQLNESRKKKRLLAKAIAKQKKNKEKAEAAVKLKEMEEKIKKDG